MKSIKFSGIYPPVITPFKQDGAIDFRAIGTNIDRWTASDLSGYVVFGSNGESVHLSGDEKIHIVKYFAERRRGKQLIAGTGMQSTLQTIELTARCADNGADAALVINPSFYGLNKHGLIDHYVKIADASAIPILIYNVPKFTGANIEVKVVLTLASHPNIAGIKDSSGDVAQMSQIIAGSPADFSVLSGTINVLLPAMAMGASGAVTALANVAPDLCLELCKYSSDGHMSDARQLQTKLIPPNVAVTKTYGIPGLKAAMDWTGYVGGWPRLPLRPLGEEGRSTLKTILQQAGITQA